MRAVSRSTKTPQISSDDEALARRSLERMRELGVVTLLPGHGNAWRGMLSEAITHAEHA